ncbi:MAG: hypothetical protein NT178_02615 [Proteobacteria bacterium]|nr:hypothetical protein [Pseudomonadota bacterium]
MSTFEHIRETLKYMIIVVVTFAVLQALVIIMHEFTHSISAWLLGCMPNPLGIVWGNPLTMTCWDEGVHYYRLFPSANCATEAIIGGSPLGVHAVIVILGLVFLQKEGMKNRKWLMHILFWFVIANFMELIAYILMRPFASGGDTGHFNRGLGLSPWILFIVGTLMIMVGLHILFRRILPLMYAIFARKNRLSEWMILSLTAFFLFLWGSGIRVVLYVYPDPQWMFGLLGFVAFCLVLAVYNPTRR